VTKAASIMEAFKALHIVAPEWAELRNSPHFDGDLRRALAGDRAGLFELAVYGEFRPQIVRDLWEAGVSICPLRDAVLREWRVRASFIIEAFGDDLDAFLRDVGLGTAQLPDEFDVWRGGDEPRDVMARARCWTRSYSVACAFALQQRLWRNARLERYARVSAYPEPIVLMRRVRLDQVAAWIGGPEREVVLSRGATEAPTEPCGSLRDWRRHRARPRNEFFWA
jgi:hypothetical protein